MKNLLRNYWPCWLLALTVLGFGIYFLDALPAQVATHFNWEGVPDRYLNKKAAVLLIPIISLLTTFFFPLSLHKSPQLLSQGNSQRLLARILFSTILLLGGIQMSILSSQLWPEKTPLLTCLPLGLGIYVLSLGFLMQSLEYELFLGKRAPWVLISEKNWLATRDYATRAFLACGALILASSLLGASLVGALALTAFSVFSPAVFSWWFYSSKERAPSKPQI